MSGIRTALRKLEQEAGAQEAFERAVVIGGVLEYLKSIACPENRNPDRPGGPSQKECVEVLLKAVADYAKENLLVQKVAAVAKAAVSSARPIPEPSDN